MKTDRAGRAAALAPLLALGAGAVWSFGTVLARVADGSDAFQYLIWRSLGIIVVVEAWALFTGRPQSTIRDQRVSTVIIVPIVEASDVPGRPHTTVLRIRRRF